MATASRAGTRLALYRDLARQLRVDSVRCSTAAGSGHPTSSLSAADLMAVLLAGHLRYDYANADDPANDHLIFSKGHASPLVYAMFRAAGAITDEELLTFRKLGSRLEGHPTPLLPWVDVATGSLGQGQGRLLPRGQGRLAWQGPRQGPGRAGVEGARRGSGPHVRRREAAAVDPADAEAVRAAPGDLR